MKTLFVVIALAGLIVGCNGTPRHAGHLTDPISLQSQQSNVTWLQQNMASLREHAEEDQHSISLYSAALKAMTVKNDEFARISEQAQPLVVTHQLGGENLRELLTTAVNNPDKRNVLTYRGPGRFIPDEAMGNSPAPLSF